MIVSVSNISLAFSSCFVFFCLYQLSHISYLQSTLYRVYLHFIHFSLLTEKEPLPQLVEVLPHAAARAATFLIVQSPGLHPTRLKSTTTSISFNLMWLRRQLLPSPAHWAFQSYAVTWTASAQRCPPYHRRLVSILCGHTDRDACTCPIASIWVLSFQSYAFNLSKSRRLRRQ